MLLSYYRGNFSWNVRVVWCAAFVVSFFLYCFGSSPVVILLFLLDDLIQRIKI